MSLKQRKKKVSNKVNILMYLCLRKKNISTNNLKNRGLLKVVPQKKRTLKECLSFSD